MNEKFFGTMDQLLAEFKANGINKGKGGIDQVVEFQDAIGHEPWGVITQYEAQLTEGRRMTFFWACANCLDIQMFYEMVRITMAKRIAEKAIDEAEGRTSKIADLTKKQAEHIKTLEDALRDRDGELAGIVTELTKIGSKYATVMSNAVKQKLDSREPLTDYEREWLRDELSK